jgi:flavodoxin
MKTAVVVYSLDGSCALVAEEIKSLLNADLIRLRLKDEKKRGKFGSLLWGGSMVFFNKKPPLLPYSFDYSAYDLIVIGAPVWAGHPAPPVNTFISETGLTGKKVAFFVCHAGGKGSALAKFKAMLTGNEIIAEADFHEPVKKNSESVKKQIADWVNSFKN